MKDLKKYGIDIDKIPVGHSKVMFHFANLDLYPYIDNSWSCILAYKGYPKKYDDWQNYKNVHTTPSSVFGMSEDLQFEVAIDNLAEKDSDAFSKKYLTELLQRFPRCYNAITIKEWVRAYDARINEETHVDHYVFLFDSALHNRLIAAVLIKLFVANDIKVSVLTDDMIDPATRKISLEPKGLF